MSSSTENSHGLPRVDFTKTETVGSTRWMRLETLAYYVDDDETAGGPGSLRKWDRVVRTTKKSETSADAVVILAVLKHDPEDPLKDQIVCVKQYRPPIDAFAVELPAGLIDLDEDPAVAAAREFTEETGYVGKVVHVSTPSFLSPGLTNESACLVRLEVDMTLPENMANHEKKGQLTGEDCEKDRGLEKLLLPRIGLLDALNVLQKRDGVKIFAALYSLAVGMAIGEDVNFGQPTCRANIPLVNLNLSSTEGELHPTKATCHAITSALRESGFLMIKTPFIPVELQQRALVSASKILECTSSSIVVTHPSDPKVYAMLHGMESLSNDFIDPQHIQNLKEWYTAARKVRDILLYCIAVGLGMNDDHAFFATLHNENNDSIRVINYLPGNEQTGNRCKEHSDYGTLTLLITDGVEGLEAFVDDKWIPVPPVEGAVVVNIGSILSEWTRGELKATLHRVAGPASKGSTIPKDSLLQAVKLPRTSIAYFADPNGDVSAALGRSKKNNEAGGVEADVMSVEEYIQWRSGGEGPKRSGIAFTSAEETRLNKKNTNM